MKNCIRKTTCGRQYLPLASRQRLYHLMACLVSQVASDWGKGWATSHRPLVSLCFVFGWMGFVRGRGFGVLGARGLHFDTRYHRASPYLLRSWIGASRE